MASVSKRYAKALLTLATEEGDPTAYLKELQRLQGPLKEETLVDFLMNPAVPMSLRRATLFEVARKVEAGPLLQRFLALMLEKHRIHFFSDIVDNYERLLQRELGQVPVRIVSAAPLDADERHRLLAGVREMVGKELVVRAEIDSTLIAGLQVEVEGKVYDGSIKNQLEKIKEKVAAGAY